MLMLILTVQLSKFVGCSGSISAHHSGNIDSVASQTFNAQRVINTFSLTVQHTHLEFFHPSTIDET